MTDDMHLGTLPVALQLGAPGTKGWANAGSVPIKLVDPQENDPLLYKKALLPLWP